MNPRATRRLIAAISSAILSLVLLRRRGAALRRVPEFVEARIVLPMGNRVREGLAGRQEEDADETSMTRKVGRNRKISVRGQLYGPLPQELAGQQVEVEERDGKIIVRSEGNEVGSFEQRG